MFALMLAGAGIAFQPVSADPTAQANVARSLERARQVEPMIHSILALDPTAAAQALQFDASGRAPDLVAGQPILIKDNVEVAGPLPTTAGSLALQANFTNRDAPLVARLRTAGAVVLGKTNLSEWANFRSDRSISGWSALGGQTRNPYALDRNPCGSSSGSGAAVAAGIVRLAIGTETDGSITCPAAINGIVGLKPTLGLVSRTHIVPISASQDTAGPMTASVREAAALLTAIAGSDPADPATREADRSKMDYAAALDPGSLKGARLGVMRFASGFGTDEPFAAALALLKAQGAVLVEIKAFDDGGIGDDEFKVLLSEFKAQVGVYLKASPAALPARSLAELIAFNKAQAAIEMPLFGQELFEQSQKAGPPTDAAYRKARATSLRKAGAEGIDRLLTWHKVVALIGPTMPPAWKIDAVNGDQISGGGAGNLSAIAGYPHLTVPMGLVKGLPVGLSFIGPKWSDAQMLSLGFAFERARGPFPAPRFLPSIEDSPPVAPALLPLRR
ncbi:MAG: amidase [Sphingomicrobium sp.]